MTARVCGAILIAAAGVSGVAHAEPAARGAPDARADAAAAPEPAATSVREPPAGPEPAPAATPLPAPVPEPSTEPRFAWQPFGYLRVQYIAVQNDPNVAFVGRDDGFELQNARLGVRGALDRRIAFEVAFDGAVDERLQVNTPQGKLRVGLRDAFADVTLAGRLFVRGGFFQALVDPEALVADTARELVDHPIESRGMRATEGFQTPGLTPGRSLGVALRFDPVAHGPVAHGADGPSVGFELAVQNGADEFSSNNDNDQPAISAAITVGLPRDGWVMAAGRFNPRTTGDLPFRQDENDLQAIAGLHLVVGPVALGGGVMVQRTSFPTTSGPNQNAFGGHAQAMLTIPAGLPLAVGYRFGIVDPSSLIPTDRVMEHTAGAVLGMPRYRMRVQLQLTHVVEQAARELENDRVQLAAELAL
jgi:hypothetical protein